MLLSQSIYGLQCQTSNFPFWFRYIKLHERVKDNFFDIIMAQKVFITMFYYLRKLSPHQPHIISGNDNLMLLAHILWKFGRIVILAHWNNVIWCLKNIKKLFYKLLVKSILKKTTGFDMTKYDIFIKHLSCKHRYLIYPNNYRCCVSMKSDLIYLKTTPYPIWM